MCTGSEILLLMVPFLQVEGTIQLSCLKVETQLMTMTHCTSNQNDFLLLSRHGPGDVTKVDILCLILTQEANYHLLSYCVEVNGELLYPFAGHSKWMYWAQNTSEHHCLNQLKQVYQKRSPEHTGMEMEELRRISFAHVEVALRRVTSQMQIFIANILESDS